MPLHKDCVSQLSLQSLPIARKLIDSGLGGGVLSVWFDRADRAMAPLRRVLAYQVSIEALIELAVWLAIPYLAIGLVWALVHPGQTQQLQTRLERVLPAGGDVGGFGLMMAFWPASIQIADACPAS